ncbi:hypothetical protein [Streptomyces sp. C1-2]|uniref:hypothetical protein n=1 Tax=Streptomyces sp. C1-2 TaxID=2720022 RepID=UPI001F102D6D|nr:hypothetical protein [Streptomyces sp. C1-2]
MVGVLHRVPLRRSGPDRALLSVTAVSPVLGAAMVTAGTVSWPWAVLLLVTLTVRTWLYLARRGAEAGIAQRRGKWQIRA